MHSSEQLTIKELWKRKDAFLSTGINVVESSIPTYFTFVTKHILESGYTVRAGQEVTIAWCESTLCQADFFSSHSRFVILNAQQISKSVADWFKANSENILDSIQLTFLTEKKLSWVSVFSERKEFSLQPYKSWERSKEISFLLELYGIKVDSEKALLLEESELSLFELANFLEISLLWNEDDRDKFWGTLLPASEKSYFDLAKLLSQKKFFQAFRPLLEEREDHVELISFYLNHLSKLMTLPVQPQQKLNNYEREILTMAKNWDSSEVVRCLQLLENALTLAKRKDLGLKSLISNVCLKSWAIPR